MTGTPMRPRPTVALIIPTTRRSQVLTGEALAHLDRIAHVRAVDGDTATIGQHLRDLLADADACLTGWGTPALTEEVLAAAPRLRLIAHTAGSVKRMIPPSVFARGIAVCHAANVIADAVAEFTMLAILLGLRRVHEMDRALKAGQTWRAASFAEPRQLAARTVGLVGAGYVGRKVARLLSAFGPRLLVYDPYLGRADASEMGAESTSLDELFRESEVVSVHAPTTPETLHLIGARQLDLLRDRAVFVNCARSWVVDQEALLATLRTGRIWAALDVFDEEPLPLDSPFRELGNVLLTPHQAGHTVDTYQRQGTTMVEEVERFFGGEELRYRISPEVFARMA
jgi:phosphoglycerate dehydrogenase-like enzyme